CARGGIAAAGPDVW
nr:immunoglobulin heavy chain junction region [Macaca mulatta]